MEGDYGKVALLTVCDPFARIPYSQPMSACGTTNLLIFSSGILGRVVSCMIAGQEGKNVCGGLSGSKLRKSTAGLICGGDGVRRRPNHAWKGP